MLNQNSDTLDQNENQKLADTGTNTPLKTEVSSDPIEELKNQVDRESARAATALKEKEAAEGRARLEKIARIVAEKELSRLRGGSDNGNGGGNPSNTFVSDGTEEEIVRTNAEKGIYGLLINSPEYQKLLATDSTLKEIITSNPLALISEYIDAEDAVEQVKKKLDARLRMGTGTSTPATKDSGSEQLPTREVPPPSGNTEMKGNITPDAAMRMSPEEWDKLSKEQRRKMLSGDF